MFTTLRNNKNESEFADLKHFSDACFFSSVCMKIFIFIELSCGLWKCIRIVCRLCNDFLPFFSSGILFVSFFSRLPTQCDSKYKFIEINNNKTSNAHNTRTFLYVDYKFISILFTTFTCLSVLAIWSQITKTVPHSLHAFSETLNKCCLLILHAIRTFFSQSFSIGLH